MSKKNKNHKKKSFYKNNFFKQMSDLSLIFIIFICMPLELYLSEPTDYTFIFESTIF
jgi:hypothetical protein